MTGAREDQSPVVCVTCGDVAPANGPLPARDAFAEDVHTFGLDMMLAALESRTKPEATAAVLAIAARLDGLTAQRVAAMLVVESVWRIRPRRSRRELREWIERRLFGVQMHGLELDDA